MMICALSHAFSSHLAHRKTSSPGLIAGTTGRGLFPLPPVESVKISASQPAPVAVRRNAFRRLRCSGASAFSADDLILRTGRRYELPIPV